MFGTPLIDPHTFSSFVSTCVKDNQKHVHNMYDSNMADICLTRILENFRNNQKYMSFYILTNTALPEIH